MTDLIERELDLAAAPADVWRAITDPEWLSGWLADSVALDLRPGGEARFQFGDEVRDGWVEEVELRRAMAPADWRSGGRAATSRPPASSSSSPSSTTSRTRLRVVETRPLEVLDLVGIPFGGAGPTRFGPALVAGA